MTKTAEPGTAPELQFKSFEFDTKAVAAEPDEDGFVYIKAYASVFDNVDSHNDMIVKGAYTETLAEWEEKGAPIPAFYNHGMFSNDPHDNVGFLSEAKEDDTGLFVTMALDVAHNPKAAYAHRLVKQDRLRELSIGYRAKSWELLHEDGKRVWEYTRKITAIDLFEVSVVPKASNSLATVTEKAISLMSASGADEQAGSKSFAAVVQEAVEALTKAAAALADAASGAAAEESEGDEPSGDENDPGQEVGEKSGKLSAGARRALALMRLSSAE